MPVNAAREIGVSPALSLVLLAAALQADSWPSGAAWLQDLRSWNTDRLYISHVHRGGGTDRRVTPPDDGQART